MDDFDSGKRKGAGGTPGGMVEFFIGAILVAVGGYLFLSRVFVTSGGFGFGFNAFGGYRQFNSFGLAMVPMLIGSGFLFFNSKNIIGWFLTVVGALIIIFGILINLRVYFQPTNLFDTLLILGSIAAGLGLVARGLQPHN